MIPFGLIYLIACESDKAVTVFNTPPTADIVSHDDGDEVFEGYPVEFRAALSDANHDTDQLTARWLVNGLEVCPSLPPEATGDSVCVATINEGDEEITVEVRDPENASNTDSITLSITSTEAPTAEIIRPEENGVFYSDHLITFEGMIGDAEDEVEELVYTWASSLDESFDINTTVQSDGSMLGSTYLSAGQHFITLNVEDTTGKTSTDSVTITVGGPNNAPTCDVTFPDPGSAGPEGDLITFTGVVDDADVPPSMLSVTWFSDKDGEIGTSSPNSSGGVTFPYTDLSVNTHVISMKVEDEKGAECVADVVYTVGTPPSITIDAPVTGTYNEDEPVVFSATVSDNEDQPDEIGLEWTLSNGEILSTQSATSDGNVEFSYQFHMSPLLPYGEQIVTVVATDTAGLTASDTVYFTINAVPTIPSLTVLPEDPKTDDDITATATGSTDAYGGTLTYVYEWVYGSTTISGSTLSSSETAKGQEWTVTVTPNDGFADGPSVSQSVTIGNTAPTDLAVTITPSSGVYNDSELTCSATANDLDSSDTLEYSYEWSTGATTETITLDGSLNPTESVTCTATVTDGTESISDSTSVTLENRAPVLSNLVIEADEGLWNGTTLTCSVDVIDADGETPEVIYSWTLADGITTVEGSELTLENVSDGDVFTCTASVEDGYNGTDTLSDSVTTTNTPPVVDTISVTPDSVNVGEHTFTCTVETSDTDGDDVDVTYEWTIDGTPQQETSNMLSGSFGLGMMIACHATPNDGKEDGNVVSDDVTVENVKPVVDSVTLSPETVYTNDTITATAVLSDADTSQSGDLTASYSWHVVDLDGNDVEVQTGTDNTLSGESHFSRDEEVYVVVTPNDGVEDGNLVTSSSITISNSIPTAPGILMYGDPNDPAVEFQDDLVCEVDPNNPSVDADGDALFYTFEWMNSDGMQQQTVYTSETSDAIDAGDLNADTWECFVSPYDGTNVGPFTTTSATVGSGCSSLNFSGNNAVINMDTSTLNTPLTFEMWLQPHAFPGGNATIIQDSGYGFFLELKGNALCGSSSAPVVYSNGQYICGEPLSLNTWNHIAVTFSATGNATYWFNGVESETSNITFGPTGTSGTIYLGAENGSHNFFDGVIGEMRISSSERYTTDFTPSPTWSLDTDTLALWSFSGSGTTLIDQTANGYDGTINGATWVNTCPEEDLDEDGVAAWEDCDDNDSTVPTEDDADCDGVLVGDDCDDNDDSVTFECITDCDNYDVFTFTGEDQYWNKPHSKVFVKMWGAGGGTNAGGGGGYANGGGGGYADAILDVPEDGLSIVVGEGGISGCHYTLSCSGGYGGGGRGNSTHGNGGGFSGVFQGTVSHSNALLIAGGGGGGGDTVDGGAGGGLNGQNSADGTGGIGGTQTEGGNSGTSYGGTELQGGSAGDVSGGGGGGGYFGGAGGGIGTGPRGEGGGGSGYDSTGAGTLETGNYVTPGNSSDSLRMGYGDGATPSSTTGDNGVVIVCYEDIDFDGDGVLASEDCDDNDSNITVCDFSSCLEILDAGQSIGDGVYSINPDGNGKIDVYCDMTTDGGGWTLVMFAESSAGGTSMYTNQAYQVSNCANNTGFCKFSDSAINYMISNLSNTDDAFRLWMPNDPSGAGYYYWDATEDFSYDNADTNSTWWSASLSYGGQHSGGCRHPVSRGVGHYGGYNPSKDNGKGADCDGSTSFSPSSSHENNLFHTDLNYVGSPNPNIGPYYWYIR